MKELSIEDKAKAYDEAIKRAQAKMEEAKVFDYDDEQTAHTIRLTTTDIFPELKESEDERIRNFLIDFIKVCGWTEKKDQGWPLREECVAWLEKQGEQMPADTEKGAKGNDREIPNSTWSEEDIVAIDCAVEFLSKDLPSLAASIERLKSLRPQNRWKPSDEQLKALKEAVDEHWEPDGLDPLYTLYQDLKKLREE